MLHHLINPREAEALELARALLAGELPDDRADNKADWLDAAQRAVDGDTHDLEYLTERAASYDAFEGWSERHNRNGNYGFDDWFHGDIAAPASFGMDRPTAAIFGDFRA